MRRKQLKGQLSSASAVTGSDPGASSPSTGAMDSLLEKLRAAAPQTRDTRDRRRRARLKDKHQVRVASGQQIPETGENVEGEENNDTGLLTPAKTDGAGDSAEGAVSEGEDVADRAASLLQGLRGDGEVSEVPTRDESGSLRIRRRRESADDERARRRARRRGAGNGSQDATQSTIAEEGEDDSTIASAAQAEDVMSNGSQRDSGEVVAAPAPPPPPTTVVVPPSPTGSVKDNEKEDES